ncbi:MAG: zinc-ribbon domain-containing protein [Acetivibrionales bacterium]|jgi:hypothetical protein
MRFCVYCGTQLDSDDRFCTACGKSTPNSKENADQQSPNNGTPPIRPQPQQYTPPVPPGQQSSPTSGQYTPPVPPVQQTYTPPQQFAGPPPYHPGASSSQNYASPGAPQPRPGGNNPFTQFSEEMNTGNIQKRTGGRGMLLGGIIGLIVLAIIIGGIIIALRPKDSSGRNDDNPKDKKSNSASIDKDAEKDKDSKMPDKEKPSNKLPENVKADAQLSDIVGYWEGTILFTRMEGFENIPEEDLPPDFDMRAFIAEVMATPVPMEIEFEEDGSWELDIDIMEGMLMGSRDYEREAYESSPLIINKLEKGTFNVNFTEKVDEGGISGEAQLSLSGSVVEEDGELSIKGTFLITLVENDIVITEEGEYTVFSQQ